MKKGYEALQAAQCYMISKIKPGVTRFGDLYSYICDKAEELGYYDYLRVKPHTTKVACFLLPMWHFAESVSL